MPLPLKYLMAFCCKTLCAGKSSTVDPHLTSYVYVAIDTTASLHNNKDNTQSQRAEKTYG
jgi:hypothetical protein